jgi:hypothetical protein
MHCKKNLNENITKTVLGLKTLYGSKMDMVKNQIRRNLWLGLVQKKNESFHMPSALYILSGAAKLLLMDIV